MSTVKFGNNGALGRHLRTLQRAEVPEVDEHEHTDYYPEGRRPVRYKP